MRLASKVVAESGVIGALVEYTMHMTGTYDFDVHDPYLVETETLEAMPAETGWHVYSNGESIAIIYYNGYAVAEIEWASRGYWEGDLYTIVRGNRRYHTKCKGVNDNSSHEISY